MRFYLFVIACNILTYGGFLKGLWGADFNFKLAIGLAVVDLVVFLLLLRKAGFFVLKVAFGLTLLLVAGAWIAAKWFQIF